MVSGYPSDGHRDLYYVLCKEYRDKNWSGTYRYLRMQNERKVYEVISFCVGRIVSWLLIFFVFRGMRKMNLVIIIIFRTVVNDVDGSSV